jgi:hypothetical protein
MSQLNDILTTIGLVTGVAGFTLAIFNYWRDNPKVRVELQWDMKEPGADDYIGIIKISNIGRRPIFISHVALRLPKGFDDTFLLLREGIAGKRLAEGDQPLIFPVTYDHLDKYKTKWQSVRAQVSDSTSKAWVSKKLHKKKKPSWANS